jgi:hypothetical protein
LLQKLFFVVVLRFIFIGDPVVVVDIQYTKIGRKYDISNT